MQHRWVDGDCRDAYELHGVHVVGDLRAFLMVARLADATMDAEGCEQDLDLRHIRELVHARKHDCVDTPGGDRAAAPDQVVQRREDTGPYTSREELRTEGLLPAQKPGAGRGSPREQENENNDNNNNANDNNGGQPNPPGAKQPELFDVKSSVFRIQGESKNGETSVGVEAYVWRDTPQEDAAGQSNASGAAQIFRVIDWRILS